MLLYDKNKKKAFLKLLDYIGCFNSPTKKVGELINKLSKEDRQLLKQLKSDHIQDRIN